MTSPGDVAAVLDGLAPPSDDGYQVAPLDPAGAFLVGRGSGGSVVLLTPAEMQGHVGGATVLRRLSAHARAFVQVSQAGAAPSDRVVGFLELRDLGDDLVPAFCGIAATVVDLVGPAPAPGDVKSALRHVIRLFEPRPGRRKSVLGVWGEVLTVLSSVDPVVVAEAWHDQSDARFDFAVPGHRLEVKTTQGAQRVHDFDLGQLRPVDGADVRVVSIVTTATEAGTSLQSLLEELQRMLALRPDLALRAYTVVADALGPEWATETRVSRWDREQAVAGLRVLDADQVPRVVEDLDAAVLKVRLTVDCEHVPSLGAQPFLVAPSAS